MKAQRLLASLARARGRAFVSRQLAPGAPSTPLPARRIGAAASPAFSTRIADSPPASSGGPAVEVTRHEAEAAHPRPPASAESRDDDEDNALKSACGDLPDEDDEMEQEEMFVDADESFEHGMAEWGGPRRGGRLPEPTRFGDWERKGRCTDF